MSLLKQEDIPYKTKLSTTKLFKLKIVRGKIRASYLCPLPNSETGSLDDQSGYILYCMARHGMLWYSMACNLRYIMSCMVWYGMVWYGMVWHSLYGIYGIYNIYGMFGVLYVWYVYYALYVWYILYYGIVCYLCYACYVLIYVCTSACMYVYMYVCRIYMLYMYVFIYSCLYTYIYVWTYEKYSIPCNKHYLCQIQSYSSYIQSTLKSCEIR